ncbi:unnamed protein product [Phaedon cochleariae]|uniref:Uncharacterized protein n=1 Tax=Phaedon cochleariae TaxID=80249 RepID=A0A9N9SGH6_PHACE|nr:unnamed protein product [Phaedon cochleariae]
MSYKCCKLKPFIHYVCTKCSSVFHKSCVQQHWKKKVRFVKDNKIICCQENTEEEHIEENSILEKTINELAEDGFLKDRYIQKLKDENQIALQLAFESEKEMNSLIERQKKLIEEMEGKIKELTKEIREKRSGVDIPILDDTLREETLTQEDRNSTSLFEELEVANISTEIIQQNTTTTTTNIEDFPAFALTRCAAIQSYSKSIETVRMKRNVELGEVASVIEIE